LVKIGDEKVEGLTYEEISRNLQHTKVPFTLTFREYPDLEQQWTEAEEHREKGNTYSEDQQIDAAIAEYTKAINLHQTSKVYYSNRALMYLKKQDYDAALQDCQKIRELDPLAMYVKGHFVRGSALFSKQEYKQAAAAFQTALKLQPSFEQASKKAARMYYKIKRSRTE